MSFTNQIEEYEKMGTDLEKRIWTLIADRESVVSSIRNMIAIVPQSQQRLIKTQCLNSPYLTKIWREMCKDDGFWGNLVIDGIFDCRDRETVNEIAIGCGLSHDEFKTAINLAYSHGVFINHNTDTGKELYSIENKDGFWLTSFSTEDMAKEFITFNDFKLLDVK